MEATTTSADRIRLADDQLDFIAGADRHRRFGDDHGEASKHGGNLARRGMDIAQVGVAVAAPRRRADGDKDRISLRHRRGKIGGKIQPARFDIGSHQRIEPGLEDRDFTPAQGRDLAGVLVDAGDLVTEIRKAGAGHQPHITRANHGDAHLTTCR